MFELRLELDIPNFSMCGLHDTVEVIALTGCIAAATTANTSARINVNVDSTKKRTF